MSESLKKFKTGYKTLKHPATSKKERTKIRSDYLETKKPSSKRISCRQTPKKATKN